MTYKDRNDEEGDLRALREALDVYVSGKSGVRFEALARFAGPLFDLYEVEWKSNERSTAKRDRDELATMLAVLETARLLWSFFLLDDERALQMLPELEDALLGRSAGDEERSNVLVLLSLMESHWQQFTSKERAEAEQTPGYTVPPFHALLNEYRGKSPKEMSIEASRFGQDNLDLPEAMALFAQPLLEDAGAEGNPDALEQQIARAQAYWELASAPPEEYDVELARILDAFARTESERAAIRREADTMMQRYRRLFPERPGGEV